MPEVRKQEISIGLPGFQHFSTGKRGMGYFDILAVTHCGRGRGDYTDPREFPLFWQHAAETVMEERKDDLYQTWKPTQSPQHTTGKTDRARAHLVRLLSTMAQEILLQFYPEAEPWL